MTFNKLMTKHGYDFYEVASSMQKAIRRGDAKLAGYFALELYESGYTFYVWKRLLIISAEDCFGIITKEVKALYDTFSLITGKQKHEVMKSGRLFVAKAVILMAMSLKSRDADHLLNFVVDKMAGIEPEDIESYFEESRQNPEPIPDYAIDCHTQAGKAKGLTKKDFFKAEQKALRPKASRQYTLFSNLVEEQE